MEIKHQLTVGQTLYNSDLREFVISKIGSKYFECEGYRRRNFVAKTLMLNSDFSFQLYTDKQFVLDKRERESLETKLRKTFGDYPHIKLSLEQLRKVFVIVNE